MKKFFPLLLVIILTFSSCITRGRENVFSREDKVEALTILSADMIAMAEDDEKIDPSVFIDALSDSFRAYDGISPIYSTLAEDYANAISEIVSPMLQDVYQLLHESATAAIDNGNLDSMITAPEGMTDAFQALLALEIYDRLTVSVEEVLSNLDNAFSGPYGIFMSVRAAYSNLSSIGVDIPLQEPEPLSVSQIAFAIEADLFTRLGENEIELKSRLPEPGSPYAVFWEGAI